ncbi:Senecionine N-oxygenase [Entomophthora muscae]|uniref:Senecionine N-oxygenase n=1 Tax=Entomophthora muscae TaxID=34485 RepID=A0ACC2S4A8_9FUNG|nr:Senecionine N-oxygenase [Entomophthora muscae]
MVSPKFKIGVLALQGAFSDHVDILNKLNPGCVFPVRTEKQLEECDALILPGGESTAISLIAERNGLLEPLRKFVRTKPTWGTCAGLILLADEANRVKQGGQELLGGLHVTVNRNQFGSQLESFEATLTIPCLSEVADIKDTNEAYRCLFIRAPVILEIKDKTTVEVLGTIDYHTTTSEKNNFPGLKDFVVAVKQDHILGTSFHPELTNDHRWHKYFLLMVEQHYI